MDVFLLIRTQQLTIFTNAKESSTILELKRTIEGILQRPPEEQRLYKDGQLLDDDNMTLLECGFTRKTARMQAPGKVELALWDDDLLMEPFAQEPMDAVEPDDSGSSEDEQAGP